MYLDWPSIYLNRWTSKIKLLRRLGIGVDYRRIYAGSCVDLRAYALDDIEAPVDLGADALENLEDIEAVRSDNLKECLQVTEIMDDIEATAIAMSIASSFLEDANVQEDLHASETLWRM